MYCTQVAHTHTHRPHYSCLLFFQHVEPEDIEGDLSHSRTHRCATITANSFRQWNAFVSVILENLKNFQISLNIFHCSRMEFPIFSVWECKRIDTRQSIQNGTELHIDVSVVLLNVFRIKHWHVVVFTCHLFVPVVLHAREQWMFRMFYFGSKSVFRFSLNSISLPTTGTCARFTMQKFRLFFSPFLSLDRQRWRRRRQRNGCIFVGHFFCIFLVYHPEM